MWLFIWWKGNLNAYNFLKEVNESPYDECYELMWQSELWEGMNFSGCSHGIEPNTQVICIDLENGIFL